MSDPMIPPAEGATVREERRIEQTRDGRVYTDEYRTTGVRDYRDDRDDGVPTLAFLVGGLLVAVIGLVLYLMFATHDGRDDIVRDRVDVTVDLPQAPESLPAIPLPDAPRLPDAPALPDANLPAPSAIGDAVQGAASNVGQAAGDAADAVGDAVPDVTARATTTTTTTSPQ